MEQTLSWVKPSSFEEFTSQGILVGEEKGQKVYIGRTFTQDGGFTVAKVIPALETAYYTFNGAENSSVEVESLDHHEDYDWVKSKKVNFDEAVAIAGSYVGRGKYNGHLVVGNVDPKTNLLVGSCEGKVVNLSSYDVLTRKSITSGFEGLQKSSSIFKSSSDYKFEKSFSAKTISNGDFSIQSGVTYEHNYMSLMSRIRQLESERSSFHHERESYEQRIRSEQRKVVELSGQLKTLRIENSRFLRERTFYEEKYTLEQTKFTELETKIREYSLTNSYLMKKIASFEEAIRCEKLLVQSITERYNSSVHYSKTLVTKLTNIQETIKTYQQRIYDLESDIMVSTSSSDSLTLKITDYEESIKYLRLQIETYNKKLEISFNDNEFLVQKLSMLTQSLRTYQSQLECLTNKLQSSKTVIATAHSDLSRSNGQIAKYQAALSSCYTTNGELMTKVSGFAAVAQSQVGSDCSSNLVSLNFGSGSAQKSFGYGSTSSYLGISSGYDSYSSTMSSTEEAQAYISSQSGEGQTFDVDFSGVRLPDGIPTTNGSSEA